VLNLKKASSRIRNDGLYATIYDEMVAEAGKEELSEKEILEILLHSPEAERYLEKYRQFNRESDISNIQLKTLPLSEGEDPDCHRIKEMINRNGDRLRALEKYGARAKDSAYSIWIGSLAVFVIFMIHNYFGLFTNVYDSYPLVIFGAYLMVIIVAFRLYFRTMKNHEEKHRVYASIYSETRHLIREGLKRGCFGEDDLYL